MKLVRFTYFIEYFSSVKKSKRHKKNDAIAPISILHFAIFSCGLFLHA